MTAIVQKRWQLWCVIIYGRATKLFRNTKLIFFLVVVAILRGSAGIAELKK